MNGFRRFYGEEIINLKELMEADRKGFIKLEYYKIKQVMKDEFASFGVEIIKKEYINKQFGKEVNSVNNITSNEKYIENVISILKRNKVTPIELDDIIKDLNGVAD